MLSLFLCLCVIDVELVCLGHFKIQSIIPSVFRWPYLMIFWFLSWQPMWQFDMTKICGLRKCRVDILEKTGNYIPEQVLSIKFNGISTLKMITYHILVKRMNFFSFYMEIQQLRFLSFDFGEKCTQTRYGFFFCFQFIIDSIAEPAENESNVNKTTFRMIYLYNSIEWLNHQCNKRTGLDRWQMTVQHSNENSLVLFTFVSLVFHVRLSMRFYLLYWRPMVNSIRKLIQIAFCVDICKQLQIVYHKNGKIRTNKFVCQLCECLLLLLLLLLFRFLSFSLFPSISLFPRIVFVVEFYLNFSDVMLEWIQSNSILFCIGASSFSHSFLHVWYHWNNKRSKINNEFRLTTIELFVDHVFHFDDILSVFFFCSTKIDETFFFNSKQIIPFHLLEQIICQLNFRMKRESMNFFRGTK